MPSVIAEAEKQYPFPEFGNGISSMLKNINLCHRLWHKFHEVVLFLKTLKGNYHRLKKLKNLNWPEPILEEFAQGLKIIFEKPDSKLLTHDTDNDTEYIQQRTKDATKDVTKNVGKDVGKDILSIIQNQTAITIPQIADILKVTQRTVERHLSRLKKENKILRIGGRKDGHWQVIE